MTTFQKLKSKLAKQGIQLTSGPAVKSLESLCSSVDEMEKIASDSISEILDGLNQFNQTINTEKKESNKKTSNDFPQRLDRFYAKKAFDGSPLNSLFDGSIGGVTRYEITEWWNKKTKQDLTSFPNSPEFYIHHSKTNVSTVILEFLKDYPYLLEVVSEQI